MADSVCSGCVCALARALRRGPSPRRPLCFLRCTFAVRHVRLPSARDRSCAYASCRDVSTRSDHNADRRTTETPCQGRCVPPPDCGASDSSGVARPYGSSSGSLSSIRWWNQRGFNQRAGLHYVGLGCAMVFGMFCGQQVMRDRFASESNARPDWDSRTARTGL